MLLVEWKYSYIDFLSVVKKVKMKNICIKIYWKWLEKRIQIGRYVKSFVVLTASSGTSWPASSALYSSTAPSLTIPCTIRTLQLKWTVFHNIHRNIRGNLK